MLTQYLVGYKKIQEGNERLWHMIGRSSKWDTIFLNLFAPHQLMTHVSHLALPLTPQMLELSEASRLGWEESEILFQFNDSNSSFL